ncbi:two-component sensor histidine kinase [Fibrisoma montanum]|uniref:Two-component sensor histidine kinase n=1 Tax=Fibrisoma montanum TaxID=2305895 RepID=A0A418MEQ9_9BACT|nr:tetratricopeptide repeat protein [Fibrisoma montanum]RIV25292.1 two-component sensor histidine kinase [Fibrisoma montanum]
MKRLLFALCLLANAGLCQTHRIDSLKRVWNNLQHQPQVYRFDTLRFQAIKALMRAYMNTNMDSSLYFNDILITLCHKPGLQKELIYAYQYAGYIHQLKGDHYSSIQLNYKALVLAEKLKQHERAATSLQGLAHAYTSLKDYTRAIELCRKGLNILRQHPDSYVQASVLNTLGAVYREQNRLNEALSINQQLYKLAKAEKHIWYEAQALHIIGWIYKDMGNITKAVTYYENALIISRQLGNVDLETSILLHVADINFVQKDWSKALRNCYNARRIALRTKNSSIVAEADEILYKIFKQTGQAFKALKAHEDFVLLRDSLSKEKTKQRIEMLQAQYDNVQKTNALQQERVEKLKQINRSQRLIQIRNVLVLGTFTTLLIAALLLWNNRNLQSKNQEINNQRALLEAAKEELAHVNKTLEFRVEERTAELIQANQELVRKNEEIRAALYKGQTLERKRVAIELHDNLSSLLSAVNMSIQTINPQSLSGSEQDVYQNIKQLVQSAYSEVRNISHNILPAELEREGLVATLNSLVSRLNHSLLIRFSLDIVNLNDRLPVEIEFNVYSIVLELLNNAIKHAQPTSVTIGLVRTQIGIELTVMDDGIGLGNSQPKYGIGLQNIQTRLDSLGGTFDVLLSAMKGTHIHIKIPIETVRIDGNVRIN